MLKEKKSRHSLRLIAASAVILALMTSCSASGESKSSDGAYIANSEEYSISDRDYEYGEDSYNLEEAGSASKNSSQSPQQTVEKDENYEDKIIRTASIDIDSSDAQKCYDTLADFAKQNGGREISVSKSSDSYGSYDYIYIQAELKILPEKLDEFIALAEKTDKVTRTEISSNDVTREYYDIKLRLETKKEALKNYYDLLKEAKTIEESLEVQRYITDLTAEIESMEGMLQYYDSKVDLSTIQLSIRQQIKVHAGVDDEFHWDSLSFSDFITLIKNGFLSVVNFLWSLLLWIIIIIAALSPLLLIAGAVILSVRAYRKKHPKKPKARKQNQPVNTVPTYMPYYQPVQPAQPVQPVQPSQTEQNHPAPAQQPVTEPKQDDSDK